MTPLGAALLPSGTWPQPHISAGQCRAGRSEAEARSQPGFHGQKLREEEASPRASKPNQSAADTGCIYTAKDSCGAVSPTSCTRPLPAPFAALLLKNFAQLQTPWRDWAGECSPCPAWGAGGSWGEPISHHCVGVDTSGDVCWWYCLKQ